MVHFLKLMNNQKSIFDIQNTSNDTSVFLSTQLYQLRRRSFYVSRTHYSDTRGLILMKL